MAEVLASLKKIGGNGTFKDFNTLAWRCRRGAYNYCAYVSPTEQINMDYATSGTSPATYASNYTLVTVSTSGYTHTFTAVKPCMFVRSTPSNVVYQQLDIGDSVVVDMSSASTSTEVMVNITFMES
jgi:hypothetical protein